MLVELVQTTTQDGIRLDGMFREAANATGNEKVDVVCLVHGTGGNFYSSSLFTILAERFLTAGHHVLSVNTRGHDLASTASTSRGGMRQGAAYEIVDHCRSDVAAWLAWLAERGCRRVALLGHSLGAVKCLYALAHDPDLPVERLIAVSPPRLSYSWFCESDKKQVFFDTYQRAEKQVGDGRAGDLLEVAFPLPMIITAAGYVEKYGPDERYNFMNFISSVRAPLLLTLGGLEIENNAAFQGTAEALAALPRRPRQLQVEIIPGGDHFYSQVREELADRLLAFLAADFIG